MTVNEVVLIDTMAFSRQTDLQILRRRMENNVDQFIFMYHS